MSTVNFSVRLISGKLQHFCVQSDTPISAIKEQLEIEQALPEFHKLSLFVGETELIEGIISEVVMLATELQAVMGASIEEAFKVLTEALLQIKALLEECPTEALFHFRAVKKAASFLLQFDDEFQGNVCEAASNLASDIFWGIIVGHCGLLGLDDDSKAALIQLAQS